MKRHLLAATLLVFPLAGFGQTVPPPSQVPSNLSFQGHVVDDKGNPIGAGGAVNRKAIFRVYSHPTNNYATSGLWSEQQNVSIAGGDFNVLLGSGAAVPAANNTTEPRTKSDFGDIFDGAVRYLGISVDDDDDATPISEISPRQQMVTGAFAFRARVAEKVIDRAITGAMIDNEAVTATQIKDGAITAAKLNPTDVGLWSVNGSNSYRSTGNVGIGTAAPAAALDVRGNAKFGTNSFLKAAGGSGDISLDNGNSDTPGIHFHYGDSKNFGIDASGPVLRFVTNLDEGAGVPRMVITDAGNVGIGTTAPTSLLDVAGNANVAGSLSTRGGGSAYSGIGEVLVSGNDVDANRPSIATRSVLRLNHHNGLSLSAHSNYGGIRFYNQGFAADKTNPYDSTIGAPPVMTVTDGKVGIGTAAPGAALDVRGDVRMGNGSSDTPGIHFYDGANTNWGIDSFGGALRFTKDLGESGANVRMTIGSGGHIGINTAPIAGDGVAIKQITGSSNGLSIYNSAGAMLFAFNCVDQYAYKHGPNTWASLSDRRLKRDIRTLSGSLDKLLSLRAVTFDYNEPELYGKGQQTGFVAQEVEEVFPDWVVCREDGWKMISPRGFEALTVQALGELRAEKDEALKERDRTIVALEARVRELERKVASTDEWKAAFEKRFASLAAATKAAPTTGNSQ